MFFRVLAFSYPEGMLQMEESSGDGPGSLISMHCRQVGGFTFLKGRLEMSSSSGSLRSLKMPNVNRFKDLSASLRPRAEIYLTSSHRSLNPDALMQLLLSIASEGPNTNKGHFSITASQAPG